jgi:hypothetical protein
MKKQTIYIIESLKDKIASKGKTETKETRPVKWIKEAENVWRIVYAD